MDSLVHPTQLSVWQKFLQARRLHKETSRSKNPDWYRPALELDYQLHFFVEEDEISDAHLFSRQDKGGGKWTRVTAPSPSMEEEALEKYFTNLRAEHFAKNKVSSLGVVLHIADEFAISELANATEKPEDLRELSEQLVVAPQEVVEDHSISTDECSFRLFPYPGAKPGQLFGAAITIGRKHQEFLRQFRALGQRLNFPIPTTAVSAPMVALAALPKLSSQLPSQPFCIFFSYSTFSVIAFFTPEGDLVMLRSVRHHAGGTPPHVGRIIQTMAAALELPEPLVFVLPLSQGRQGEIVSGLPELPNATVLNWRDSSGFDADVPLEFQGTEALVPSGEEPTGLAASQTFRELAERQWATQDFLPPLPEESEMLPSQMEMRVLRFGGIGLRVGAAALVVLLGWTSVRAFKILRDPAWHPMTTEVSDQGNQVLTTQINRFTQWDALLGDRSKAWVTMELVNQLFPNPDSVIISSADYLVRPEVLRDQERSPFIKKWEIKGLVNDEALEHLTMINTREGIKEVFQSVYRLTSDESLRTDLESRNLVVNLLASENRRYNPDSETPGETQFPFMFNLTVTQHVSAEDPIAIPTAAAP